MKFKLNKFQELRPEINAKDASEEPQHIGKWGSRDLELVFCPGALPGVAFTLESFEKDTGLIGSFQVFTPQSKIKALVKNKG